MSSIAPKPQTGRSTPHEVIVLFGRGARAAHTQPRTWLALTWAISRAAAAAAGLVPAEGDAEPMLELSVPWGPGGAVGDSSDLRAGVLDGPVRHELSLEAVRPGAWAYDAASDLHHLELPGLAQVSIRVTPQTIQVLYARTEVLGRLGLAGGRYDFAAASIVTDPA